MRTEFEFVQHSSVSTLVSDLAKISAASAITTDQVSDANTVKKLAQYVEEAGKYSQEDDAQFCKTSLSVAILSQRAAQLEQKEKSVANIDVKLKQAANLVTKSEAKRTLSTSINTGAELANSAQNNVADSATITELKKVIKSAKKVLNNKKATEAQYTDANTNVQNAITAVNASVATKQAQEADATRCSTIAATYLLWQGDASITLAADCSLTVQSDSGSDSGNGNGSTTTTYAYSANSFSKDDATGVMSWEDSQGATWRYIPSGQASNVESTQQLASNYQMSNDDVNMYTWLISSDGAYTLSN